MIPFAIRPGTAFIHKAEGLDAFVGVIDPSPMPSAPRLTTNFACLGEHDEQLLRLGMLAERYFPDDPNTCLLKLRQLAEALAQATATRVGVFEESAQEGQYELLGRLRDHGILPPEVYQLFGEVRRTGNAASHALAGDHRAALATLKVAWQLGLWFHRTFKDPKYRSGPFLPPRPPKDESAELRVELSALSKAVADHHAAHQEQSQQVDAMAAELRAAKDEQSFWEQMAAEAEAEKSELLQRLAAQQAQAAAQPASQVAAMVQAAGVAAGEVTLDEAGTRRIIDQQLRDAGWEADTETLRFSHGARPEKGKNRAIAEWPTASGPADYVLFAGLTPLAAVEAKRKLQNVSGALQQAKRYSRDYKPSDDPNLPGPGWGASGELKLPFIFSTNGRPWLRQLTVQSGIWFRDLRRPDNLAHPLQGWHSPQGLQRLLEQDITAAHQQLAHEPFDYGFTVREYQQRAILAIEAALATGQRELLLAMATGTGKTKTCIALIYRLLKAKRFRRILFLVDRSALGEQAAGAFKETRMEGLQAFADVFGIKELDEPSPDDDTAVHLATIQGMVRRVLQTGEESPPPPVDQYDCLIVDECHRGYLLDRELSETELSFRGFDDYVSTYRRVLDYFAAVKIGLTATPALHTTQIFGPPIFSYSYREAVLDGFLVDHEPPIQIKTELSEAGIAWQAGDRVTVYDPHTAESALVTTPDDLQFDVEDFNRKVITESFNRVVCEFLAGELDPTSPQKTLVFCANDAHADLVVHLLKAAFRDKLGAVDDDAVVKITGAAEKPLQLIRLFKNERNPTVAVTVDLLTTGVDVPAICHLVFLRRVNSRILYDQMLGRATRLCEDIGKESFRIFDAVGLYDSLEGMTAMRPVVVNPSLSFSQLQQEMTTQGAPPEAVALVRDQFVAKLRRKKRYLDQPALDALEALTGLTPEALIGHLRVLPLPEIAPWFTSRPEMGPLLDRKTAGTTRPPVYVSDHDDQLVSALSGYGQGSRPEDYLREFDDFIRSKQNDIPALITLVTRPRELTRAQLREIRAMLDQAGFSEIQVTSAWRDLTNKEIAAGIVGHIRRAALGDPLIPYEQRVEAALQTILASRKWSANQREWLKKLAAQTKANTIVDRSAVDDPAQLFKREGGGFPRLNKIFDGQFAEVLDQFNDALWPKPA